ncbi:hypothetical protein [Glutamicibacter arilaitensis]|uniref:hypothetical protein n=1 Tax=Glutamicibacter arilaitensis TaxID=256701 RepID=UPI00384E639B
MKSRLPRASRNYVEQLRQELSHLTSAERNKVIEQTRAKIQKLPGRGRKQVELIEQLGTPGMRAAKFQRTEPEALQVRSGKEFLNRILGWPILAFALLTTVVVYFGPIAAPGNSGEWTPFAGADGALARFEAVVGAQVIWVAMLPVLLSVLGLYLQNIFSTIIGVLGASAITLVVIAGSAGIGLFFLPITVLLWAQVLTPLIMMRGSMARPGPLWLIAGALLVLATGVWVVSAGLRATELNGWLIIGPASLLGLLAVLLPTRQWWAHVLLVSVGILVIAAGLVAAMNSIGALALIGPWVFGGVAFAVGHLALAGSLWHERARKLLALY